MLLLVVLGVFTEGENLLLHGRLIFGVNFSGKIEPGDVFCDLLLVLGGSVFVFLRERIF